MEFFIGTTTAGECILKGGAPGILLVRGILLVGYTEAVATTSSSHQYLRGTTTGTSN